MKIWVLFFFAISIVLNANKINAELLPPPGISQSEIEQFGRWQRYFNENKKSLASRLKKEPAYLNELIYSQSPYLEQHAFNPINWKSWSSELLNQAKKNNKLIFLSIGYSTCHWCHTMEKESFVDVEIARILNRNFYSIKVDREELPHIDDYYSAALEHVKGSAGWPITAIINSDGLPVFIDSYLPKEKLRKLLGRVGSIWRTQPEFLLASAKNIDELINNRFNQTIGTSANKINFETINQKLLAALDPVNGGFSGAAKFPSEAMLLYVLDQLRRGKNTDLEKALKLQLDKMIQGGLYDHISGGFHRYSTDPGWVVPHYEKMLYNQAQLVSVYSQAYQYFRDPVYFDVVESTIKFMLTELYDENGGFWSAIDADFNGEEGGYYLWTPDELALFNLDKLAYETYQIPGSQKLGVVFPKKQLSPDLKKTISSHKEILVNARKKRGSPHIDQKVITGWNALAIKALIDAETILETGSLVRVAEKLADKFWKERYQESTGMISRVGFKGEKLLRSYLDDYAYFCDALIALYDVSDDIKWLKKAQILKHQATKLFLDAEGALYNIAPRQNLLSLKKSQDGELYAASAVMLGVIWKLDKRLGEEGLKKKFSKLIAVKESKIAKETLNHLYSALSLQDSKEGSTWHRRYFASAKGRLNIKCSEYTANRHCRELSINVKLEDGWHINSNQPLQNYLIPTKIDIPEGVEVTYPEEKRVKLGFQDEALSVYEGSFEIRLKNRTKNRLHLTLPLQACNDRICLLPESLKFVM
ncbi:DUF255 domain-containing protein [Aliikangiella coralliicola]|uniref:DUF255 domain-containing protein n=1 Tax=Aliikangiella coralliicola TaxID=2592383 RepID=A0A545TSM7_9GAMM|nr:DUF255 domain-containing protein [Aliikangiella coralliicola]TQV80226.1 DUF255 domain-containing protein [Aliikangiella coralliicola]